MLYLLSREFNLRYLCGRILSHQEQLSYQFNHMTRLKDKSTTSTRFLRLHYKRRQDNELNKRKKNIWYNNNEHEKN